MGCRSYRQKRIRPSSLFRITRIEALGLQQHERRPTLAGTPDHLAERSATRQLNQTRSLASRMHRRGDSRQRVQATQRLPQHMPLRRGAECRCQCRTAAWLPGFPRLPQSTDEAPRRACSALSAVCRADRALARRSGVARLVASGIAGGLRRGRVSATHGSALRQPSGADGRRAQHGPAVARVCA